MKKISLEEAEKLMGLEHWNPLEDNLKAIDKQFDESKAELEKMRNKAREDVIESFKQRGIYRD